VADNIKIVPSLSAHLQLVHSAKCTAA